MIMLMIKLIIITNILMVIVIPVIIVLGCWLYLLKIFLYNFSFYWCYFANDL